MSTLLSTKKCDIVSAVKTNKCSQNVSCKVFFECYELNCSEIEARICLHLYQQVKKLNNKRSKINENLSPRIPNHSGLKNRKCTAPYGQWVATETMLDNRLFE